MKLSELKPGMPIEWRHPSTGMGHSGTFLGWHVNWPEVALVDEAVRFPSIVAVHRENILAQENGWPSMDLLEAVDEYDRTHGHA